MTSFYKMNCFPELYTRSRNKINIELDLSNYATKFYLKNTPDFDKKAHLASLKLDTDDLDIGKIKCSCLFLQTK